MQNKAEGIPGNKHQRAKAWDQEEVWCIARFLMNPENPPPYPGPGPTAPYPPYPPQPMGPMGAPPPQGYPYPPPQGYPYQGYPQYGWQGGPQEPPKTTDPQMSHSDFFGKATDTIVGHAAHVKRAEILPAPVTATLPCVNKELRLQLGCEDISDSPVFLCSDAESREESIPNCIPPAH
ncbi:hypothetical protein STEG23_013169 [Scotinomys teguina]